MHSGDLAVLRGTPTPEELAALVGALRAVTRRPRSRPVTPPSVWALSARPGFTPSWRHSALPR
ncbi:acyl-CoA carboxylase subunit epsilon [Catenuloplanes japonicus]|uniref:acyl-CoA carboxylase subunit epsilon n=1 Tax=Catenuloplanes japonicus TaxID=33876 RepID=UPI000A0F9F1F|nr:acyl-CoA carboxylase subunit epsilon [Catenuloplanes japonicus]